MPRAECLAYDFFVVLFESKLINHQT